MQLYVERKLFMKKLFHSFLTMVLSMVIIFEAFPAFNVRAASSQYVQTLTNASVTYTYTVSNSKVSISKVTVTSSTSNLSLTMPDTISGYNITSIGANAFSTGSNKISTLKLPMPLQYVESQAFHALSSSMTTIYVPQNLAGIDGSAFGPNTKVSNLYIRTSSTANKLINSANVIKSSLKDMYITSNGNLDQFVTCDKNGNIRRFGFLELIDSLSYSPAMYNIYESYAAQIIDNIVSRDASDLQKMQMIYNYVITNSRYSNVYSGNRVQMIDNLPTKALGTLIFGIGTCGSRADTIMYLGKAAGLDVKTISVPGHRLNVFRPSGSKVYYYVDTCANTFVLGSNIYSSDSVLKTDSYTADDETVCQIASTYYGSTIQVLINNNTSTPFEVCLVDKDNSSKKYIDYTATNSNDNSITTPDALPMNKNVSLYAYSNSYYNLIIKQNGTTVLTLGTALNRGNSYTSSFVDKNGNKHTYTISIKNDAKNDRTDNHAYFQIDIN